MIKYARVCNIFMLVLCASLAACGGATTPTAPTPVPEPTPEPELITTIGGKVYNIQNGNAVANATIEVLNTDLRITTDSNGRYRLEGIKSETFTVRYSHLEYRTADKEYTIRLGNEPTNVDVGLTPIASPTTTISGKVTSFKNGTSITGATVEVVKPETDAGLKTMTGSDGRYRLEGIKSETFTVRYSHLEYQTADKEYTIKLGNQPANVDVGLAPALITTISGTIYGGTQFSAVLVANATIEVTSPAVDRGLRTTSNSQGFYRLSGVKSRMFVVVYSHPNWDSRSVEWTLDLGTVGTTQNVLLRPK